MLDSTNVSPPIDASAALAPLTSTAPPAVLTPLSRARDAACFGHKASTLAALIDAGFDVPAGFVVPVGGQPDRASLAAALEELGGAPVAVRSSGVAEDLDDASYAGQYDTVLDVTGADAVLEAIRTCLASANGARVATYELEADARSHEMAVLVQTLVRPDAAGVAFSANPLTGDRDEVVVNATRGLADRMVAGEIDSDEWRVRRTPSGDSITRAISQPQGAIDASDAAAIAALARRVEEVRRGPQDIEWALANGRLYLLQARPITMLPVAPEIEAPKGTWEKDASHFPGPVCPFAATTHLDGEVFGNLVSDIGLMIDNIEGRVIGHEVYIHIEPDDGGSKPPPWWVVGLVVRLLPSLRKKMRRAKEVLASGYLTELPRRWNRELRTRQLEAIERFAAVELAALDEPALVDHVRALRTFAGESMRLHFELVIPHAVGTHELVSTCEELLGWDTSRAAQLLQGLSTASSAPTRELAAIADLARPRGATRAIIETGAEGFLEELRAVDPEVHDRIREHLRFWGLRTFGPDVSAPNVADRLDLVAGSIAALIAEGAIPDLEPARQELIAEARARLSDPAARRRFDESLAFAELTYPLREDNVILTDQMVIGLLRVAGLEVGRRLVARGLVAQVEDVWMLTVDEAEEHLAHGRDARVLVKRRRAEMLWVSANPGPLHYGPAPSSPPSLRGLPEAARRLNGGLLFLMEEELARPAASSGDGIQGIAASSGVYRGKVRVITDVHDLHELEPGEVLVCPSTTAAWMMVFNKAGALVTDHGSVLTHTSIVAREHRLPAVVATQRATTELETGDEVIVDGTRGTVTLVSAS